MATGPEAASFLHGQVSQDVTNQDVGESRLSFLLQPQGKLDTVLRITRIGEESFVLDTDGGYGSVMTESLFRFKLRTRVEFEASDWSVLAVFGADSEEISLAQGSEIVVDGLFGDNTGVDLIGPNPRIEGAIELTAEQYERLRIQAGFPLMGLDLDTKSIPNETGLVERAVSFSKGCYRGQELVERIHSRGGNRKLLQRLDLGNAMPIPGAVIMDADRVVGTVTSVSFGEPTLALGYVRGDVDHAGGVTVVWDGDNGETHRAAATLD